MVEVVTKLSQDWKKKTPSVHQQGKVKEIRFNQMMGHSPAFKKNELDFNELT